MYRRRILKCMRIIREVLFRRMRATNRFFRLRIFSRPFSASFFSFIRSLIHFIRELLSRLRVVNLQSRGNELSLRYGSVLPKITLRKLRSRARVPLREEDAIKSIRHFSNALESVWKGIANGAWITAPEK